MDSCSLIYAVCCLSLFTNNFIESMLYDKEALLSGTDVCTLATVPATDTCLLCLKELTGQWSRGHSTGRGSPVAYVQSDRHLDYVTGWGRRK